ncbi:MAG TPA: VWA domain-containing protein [Candidatus Saccharimonadales bacterium]|nr:VWA domain-containing protein [Candidatus Saccharimonadales bacterium]
MPNLQLVKQKVQEADKRTGGSLLTKVTAAQTVMVKKRVNPNQQWEVILLVDASGSMDPWYRNGSVQQTVERALGFAVIVDDDGKVPVVTFGQRKPGVRGNPRSEEDLINRYVVDLGNYHGFIQNNGIYADWGTPMTEAVIHAADIAGHGDLFPGGVVNTRNEPVIRASNKTTLVVVACDGRPNSPRSMSDAIRVFSHRSAEFKFLFVGNDERGWDYLESLDDDIPVGRPFNRGGRLFDNVDSKRVDLRASDEKFYEDMLDELPSARAAMVQHGLLV